MQQQQQQIWINDLKQEFKLHKKNTVSPCCIMLNLHEHQFHVYFRLEDAHCNSKKNGNRFTLQCQQSHKCVHILFGIFSTKVGIFNRSFFI